MNDNYRKFYIEGKWQAPLSPTLIDVVNPATEEPFAQIAGGNSRDVDRAVAAARAAFPSYAMTSREDRIALLRRIDDGFKRRREDLAQAMSHEMGVPITGARNTHFPSGPAHLQETIKVLSTFAFEARRGTTMVAKEPIGVCALITPWNFPVNQVMCKVAPALAAGCTMVLKPSEVSPLSALIIAEILHEAGVPAGVFNLVNGDGANVGHAMAAHSDIDMVSFTGSTRAGIAVAKAAADTVKRVAQELGGKSPNILLPDADFDRAVSMGVARCFNNSGQSCVRPTRMLVPAKPARGGRGDRAQGCRGHRGRHAVRRSFRPGPGRQPRAVREGAAVDRDRNCRRRARRRWRPGPPCDLSRGFFVRPTVFVDVDPRMAIAREEIFGPVLSVIAYENEDDAVRIANDTPYGLAAYVQSTDLERARSVARRLRAGNVQINYPSVDRGAPFGGYKQSGNGREWGEFGLNEYLEIKGIPGYDAPAKTIA